MNKIRRIKLNLFTGFVCVHCATVKFVIVNVNNCSNLKSEIFYVQKNVQYTLFFQTMIIIHRYDHVKQIK